MISELLEVYNYDPLHIPQPTYLQWFCIGIIVAYFGLILYMILFHGTVFNMGSDTYFTTGYPANGDASIFGPDGFHFRGE